MRGGFRFWLVAVVVLAPLAGAAAQQPGPGTVQPEILLDDSAPRVFEQLGRLFGVRIQVDEELRRPVRLELRQMDLAAGHLGWK